MEVQQYKAGSWHNTWLHDNTVYRDVSYDCFIPVAPPPQKKKQNKTKQNKKTKKKD